jgi:hypothetical protein
VEEADESVYWLELIRVGHVSPDPSLAALLTEANELSAIFNQSQMTAKANAGPQRQSGPSRNKFVNS